MRKTALLAAALAAFTAASEPLPPNIMAMRALAHLPSVNGISPEKKGDVRADVIYSITEGTELRFASDLTGFYPGAKKVLRLFTHETAKGQTRVTYKFDGLKPDDAVELRYETPDSGFVLAEHTGQAPSDGLFTIFTSAKCRRDGRTLVVSTAADKRGTAQLTVVEAIPRRRQPPPRDVRAKRVTVENTLDVDRGSETVSVPLSALNLGDRDLRVYSCADETYLPHQTWNGDGGPELIFSAKFPAKAKLDFIVASDPFAPDADLADVCVAEHAAHRMDDMLWENDMFALRTYGHALALPPPKGQSLVSSGMDVLVKNVPFPRLHDWTMRNRTGYNYHLGEGEGHDNYLLGTARGLGGLAAFDGERWSVSSNWVQNSHRIIAQGPVRCSFELSYAPWCSAKAERRRVTFDRGQPFCKMEAFIDDIPEGTKIGPGLDISAKRKHAGTITSSANDAWIANFEPKDGFMGSIETAVVLAPEHKSEFVDSPDDCRMLLSSTIDGKLTWYIGSGWDLAGHYRTSLDWGMAVKAFSAGLRTPLNVTIQK